LALLAQDPNPGFDKDPNVLAAGDLKLNFNGLYLPFLDSGGGSVTLTVSNHK